MPGHYRQVPAEKRNVEAELQEFDKRAERRAETLPQISSTNPCVEFLWMGLSPEI